jgi:D-glycero-D-manno-heptose 1,7-bisphosphate phosphatase
MKRAIFLDRDGVLNENRDDYVKGWDEFIFLPGAIHSLQKIASTSFLVVVVTNQSAINQGLVLRETVDAIHRQMISEVSTNGGRIDAVYYCPHTSKDDCECRKPKPGLMLTASRELGIDLSRSYVVGDKLTDLAAGYSVGCSGILVRSGKGLEQDAALLNDKTPVVTDILAAMDLILTVENQAR